MEVKEAVKEDKNSGYKQLLNEKNFLLNTFANIVSRFGDGIDTIAFSLLVYQITGSTLLVATLYAINGIPNIIFSMVSGVVCKYITDKKIMAICDFGRGACVTLVAVLFITGNLATWHLYVITFLNSSFESFRGPATTSIIPKILPQEKMEYGMAFMSSGTKVAEMIGLASAAFLIGILGLGGAIIVDAVTFYICGVLIILAGIFSIIRAFAFTNNVFLIANGTISILFGLLLCFSPVATIDTLALFFGVWAIIRGIYLFIMAIKHKNLNFNFHTIYIILLFLLGLLILFNPLVTILATPYIIGTFFIISAVCEIYLGFKI